MNSSFINTQALVLNRRKRREGDLLVTLFTKSLGKINCIAKGAQSIKSRRLGHLEIGNLINCHLYQKNNFYWLSESEAVEVFLNNPKKLSQYGLLFFFYEVINQLLPLSEPSTTVCGLITVATRAISQNNYSQFIDSEINLIEQLGYGLPSEIDLIYKQKKYQQTQILLRKYFESILEKPLNSPQSFK